MNRVLAGVLLALCGCASTTTTHVSPSPQLPVCQASASAVVVWAPQWRADQKDIPARETAAAEGIARFFKDSGCFASVSLRRVSQLSTSGIASADAEAGLHNDRVIAIAVRELGPVVRLGSSLALVEGGTEVVLDIEEHEPANPTPRSFSVHWLNGGPGVVKGVATLSQDMESALTAGLQPGSR